ncbi:uncharacterized protein LDX57_012798 [Aspergillus melleus]|uniref:uncharacterized protein n=1 Tax=Aspergillus melleus TaxID=138277 RepID=UPI001E8E260D|nr:uncharacterized protein LDX57_012798 [Aspergillus melleus]KAH8435169.1 hypothetical protein LDX57_012798 [Aspergillus melleus]
MIAHSFVRRGMELIQEQAGNPDGRSIEFQGWQAGLLCFTVIAFIFSIIAVDYTYGMLVPTLAAIEDSNPDIFVRIDTDQDPTKPIDPADADAEIVVTSPRPITSKLRTTIKHLRARAGFWSRFRGFAMFVVLLNAQGILGSMIPVSMSNYFGQFIVRMIVGILLANLHLAWIHIVISEPSPKRFYQRIPGYKSWVNIAPVYAFEQAVVAGAFFLPLMVGSSIPSLRIWPTTEADLNLGTAARVAGAVTIPFLFALLVSMPARAVFIRVAASMLPEEDEAIVPFDRSFGGKVVPAILGGSGRLSISGAWKTFDGAARARYFKAIFKALAIQMAITTFFTLVLAGQAYMFKDSLKVVSRGLAA